MFQFIDCALAFCQRKLVGMNRTLGSVAFVASVLAAFAAIFCALLGLFFLALADIGGDVGSSRLPGAVMFIAAGAWVVGAGLLFYLALRLRPAL
jgi:hypothetical protein